MGQKLANTFELSEDFRIALDDPRVRTQGLRIAIIGESGSGKSWTVAVIVEQAISSEMQVVVIDPHGEYWPLAERFPDVVIIGGENADLPLSEDAIDVYAEAYGAGKTLVFNLKEYFTDDEQYGRLVEKFLRALWKVQVNSPRPALWVLEEAQLECPQEKTADTIRRVGLVKAIATGGRKFGVHMILGTQRPAELHKTPLSQCWVRIFGKLTERLDREAVKDYLKPLSADELKSLTTGEFYIYGWKTTPFRTRISHPRMTRHGAETPLIEPIQRRDAGERMAIDDLRRMVEERLKDKGEERTLIASLEAKLRAAEKKVTQMAEKANVADVLRDGLSALQQTGPGQVPPETLARLEELERNERRSQDLEKKLQASEARAEQLASEIEKFAGVTEALDFVRRGLAGLGIAGGGSAPAGAGDVDIDAVVQEVLRRSPAGSGPVVLEAPTYILKDYQQREVDRILAAVHQLSTEQRDLLRFVSAVGRVDRREAARSVFGQSPSSFKNRTWSDSWTKEKLMPLVDIGAVKWDSSHGVIIYHLQDHVRARLQIYKPSQTDIDQVMVAIATALAKDKE